MISRGELFLRLCEEQKISSLRNAFMVGCLDGVVFEELFAYMDKDDIEELFEKGYYDNDISLSKVLSKSNIPVEKRSMVWDVVGKDLDRMGKVVSSRMSSLTPCEIDNVFKYSSIKKMILSEYDSLSKESFLHLYNKGLISLRKGLNSDTQRTWIISESAKTDEELSKTPIDSLLLVVFMRKLNHDEISYIMRRFIDENGTSLVVESVADALFSSQDCPLWIIDMMVKDKRWHCDIDKMWFSHLLAYQNLDEVLEYIVDNMELNNSIVKMILSENRNTSKIKLCSLWDKYKEAYLESDALFVPVLDSHLSY